MKIVELRQEADFENLRADWNRLLSASASNTIFLTWEWLSAWWSAYGVPGDLRILTAHDGSGALCGIAPLRVETKSRYGQKVSAFRFMGAGSNDTDYLDFIIEAGREEQVMAAFRAHIEKQLAAGAVFEFNEVPESSPNLPILRSWAAAENLLWMESDIPCGTVRLPQTWDEYLGMLKPRFRTKVRSVLRGLEARSDVRNEFCESSGQVEQLLPELFDLHTKRWAVEKKPGVFGWKEKRVFYQRLSQLLLERGWLRFSRLSWKGQTLACQYGFVYDGVYSQLQEGYEPASEHWNVGVGLRAWTIGEFLKEGVHEYDFLGGVGRHKTDWGCEVKQSKYVLLAKESYKNRLYCRGPEWEERAKELVKRVAPEKALAMRKAHILGAANGNGAGNGANGNGANGHAAPGDWMRNAIAECYYRFNINSLSRKVRNQYRLSTGSSAKWPKLSRRQEATGRILYYHRVNDDNDPFFPAMSTQVFDRLMQVVSRNYTVVSLTEMLQRFEDGSPEQLMAITFDDGYRDNYQQALPILERYGLPATIFLATGPIDSREPLWFERLALALKKTDREFLELEIDVPRRLPLKTQAERLDANTRILAIMRGLSDTERRQWLEVILANLGVEDDERRGKMLTWDEVRLMKTRGIDFGGHTVTHPFVSKLTPEQVSWEASECKRRIEAELQMPVQHFAYPNGREEDFGGVSNKELIRASGYQAALTTIWGSNHRSTDRMELRRGGPWEENPAVFAYKMDWYELADC
ncbi:MAG TPA: GNAT family N-acetyltransferase [Bryobacteraceae bacterium]|nr:GNAT family N-acetyltransferase [Bryobacteraceae bacterium]